MPASYPYGSVGCSHEEESKIDQDESPKKHERIPVRPGLSFPA